MSDRQIRNVALGAGVLAGIAAIGSGRPPRGLRVLLVFGLAALSVGFGVYVYRSLTRPLVLTVAISTRDGEGTRLASVIATQMAASGSPVRLKVVDKATIREATSAFASGEANLVLARADADGLTGAQSIAVMSYGVLLVMAPAGSALATMDDLKGKSVGVIAEQANQKVLRALARQYDFDRAKTRFSEVAVASVQQAFRTKQIDALLVVTPLSEQYLTLLRGLLPKSGKKTPTVLPVEAAAGIAAVETYFESFELPKGAFSGSPAVPDDDIATLRVPFYLMASKKLSDRNAGALAHALIDARRDLIAAYPVLSQISAPNTDRSTADKDAFIPVHPGAAAYYNGEEVTFFDKYGDALFYGSTILGALASILVAAWKYMAGSEHVTSPPQRLYALLGDVSSASSLEDLARIEHDVDALLEEAANENEQAESQAAAVHQLDIAARRVERAIDRRRQSFEKGEERISG